MAVAGPTLAYCLHARNPVGFVHDMFCRSRAFPGISVHGNGAARKAETGYALTRGSMEIALAVFAFLFLLAGLVGSVLPVLPGPPLGFVGLLLLHWSGFGTFGPVFLWVWGAIVLAVSIVDFILPAWLTKRFGGSRMAVTGSVLGLVAGLFFLPPLGLLIGPFLGALIGELIHNRNQARRNQADGTDPGTADAGFSKALKVALGAFLAFILGTGAKLIVGVLMLFFAVRALF